MAEVYPDLKDRPVKETICLFDVDGTLTPARGRVSAEMLKVLSDVRRKCALGFVGGSDLVKQEEQLGTKSLPAITMFDFCFSENGLTYRQGERQPSNSFIQWLGEEKVSEIRQVLLEIYLRARRPPGHARHLHRIRTGMVNISPVGRNASTAERNAFEQWDKKTGCRAKMIEALKKEFADYGLTYSIGGQISFDVFPHGWDKTYCLQHVEAEADPAKHLSGINYKNIHFFGDKSMKGGNDYEIYEDPRTIGHAVTGPEDTMRVLKELFNL